MDLFKCEYGYIWSFIVLFEHCSEARPAGGGGVGGIDDLILYEIASSVSLMIGPPYRKQTSQSKARIYLSVS